MLDATHSARTTVHGPWVDSRGSDYSSDPDLPPAIDRYGENIRSAFLFLLASGATLAALLPGDLREAVPAVDAWVRAVQERIPYVAWVEKHSRMPGLASVWFAVMWPLLLAVLAVLVARFPFATLPQMARRAGLTRGQQFAVAGTCMLGAWMAYAMFFARDFLPGADAASAQGRVLEAIALDTRLGLATVAPVLLTVCAVVWGAAIFAVLLVAGRLHAEHEATQRT